MATTSHGINYVSGQRSAIFAFLTMEQVNADKPLFNRAGSLVDAAAHKQ